MKKRNLLFIFILTGLVSCITREKCNERFPPQVKDTVFVKDSSFLVRDTFYIEPDQIILHDSIPCPDYHHTITGGHLTATISINKGKLSVICKSDSLQKIIDEQRHIITTSQSKVEIHNIIEYRTRWIDTTCRWISGIILLLIIGWVAGKWMKLTK